MRPLGEAQSKVTRAYAQSRQYHTIAGSRVHLTWYQRHALKLAMSIESSNVEQRTPKKRSRASIKGRRTLFKGKVLDESPG